jgi:WD40 repeat protein
MVAKWDIKNRKPVAQKYLEIPSPNLDVSPDGKVLVVGTVYGDLKVLRTEDLEELREDLEPATDEGKEIEGSVRALRFSPKGEYLFVTFDCETAIVNNFCLFLFNLLTILYFFFSSHFLFHYHIKINFFFLLQNGIFFIIIKND